MSFILFLIIFLVVLPYLIPALLRWIAGYAIKRKTRQMQDEFARAAGIDPDEMRRRQAQQERASREGGWTAPAAKPKKFNSDEGEYVRFNDVETETSANNASQTSGQGSARSDGSGSSGEYRRSEQQVEDVTWEDID
jgi:Sec-independent protein translocase protein TatA